MKCECTLENPCDIHNGTYDEWLAEQEEREVRHQDLHLLDYAGPY
jgi:hypothetical protein